MRIITILLLFLGLWLIVDSVTLDRILLPFRVAQLATQEPDKTVLIPVEGVRVADVTDTWQAPRPGGRQHEGQDVFAPKGTNIYSATDGYVVRKGENPLGGNILSVAGKGGRFYYYAHLDDFALGIAVGKPVNTTTLLGYVGNTGDAATTPPHLHFGLYHYKTAQNPYPLFVDRK